MFLFTLFGVAARLLDSLQESAISIVVTRHSLTTAQLSKQFELVGSNFLITLCIVAVEPDVDFVTWIVLILVKLDLTCAFCRAKKLQADLTPDRQFVVLGRNLLRRHVHVNSTTPAEH